MTSKKHDVPEHLNSRYKDFELIGTGAMGRVFKAFDEVLLIDVAIKLLPETRDVSSEATIRFQKEARAASKLKHKNVLTIMDFGITDASQPYLVMEYLNGKTLASILSKEKTLPLSHVINIISQICDGMEHAHKLGVVHRDLKPANVMILGEDLETATVSILDFGIAKVETIEVAAHSVTPQGSLLGTPHYMSPEQISSEQVDSRSDIYAVGGMLFHMLTGCHPFEGDSVLELLQAKRDFLAPSVNSTGSHSPVSEAIETVVARCLDPDPNNRYATMLEVKEHLIEAAEMHATPTANPEIAFAHRRAAKLKRSLAGCIIVILIGSVLGILHYSRSASNSAPAEDATEKRPAVIPEPIIADGTVKKTTNVRDLFKISKHNDKHWTATEHVTDAVLAELIDTPIEELKLESQNDITAKGCAYIAQFPQLRILEITDSILGDDGLIALSKAPKLGELSLEGTQVTDAGVASLVKSSVVDLNLSRTRLSDEGLKSIGKMKSLNRLSLSGTRVTGAGLQYIKHHPLECLHIEGLEIDDDDFKNLPGMTRVKVAGQNKKVAPLRRIYCTQLKITERGLRELVHCDLEHLNLSACPNINDKCVAFIVRTWPNLTILNLNDSAATAVGVKELRKLTNLKELGVAGLNLTDEMVLTVLTLPKLETLTLSANPITDLTLSRLHLLPRLKKVGLMHCRHLTDEGLSKADKLPGIEITCPERAVKVDGAMDIF